MLGQKLFLNHDAEHGLKTLLLIGKSHGFFRQDARGGRSDEVAPAPNSKGNKKLCSPARVQGEGHRSLTGKSTGNGDTTEKE